MSRRIRVLVNGARGRMGMETLKAVGAAPDLECVGGIDLGDDLAAAIRRARPDAVVDFTRPEDAFRNLRTILQAGARPISGTTGFSTAEIRAAARVAKKAGLGAAIVPNFALGAALAVHFAREAARSFPSVEILERHHEGKADAPSGTALLAARAIAAVRGARSRGAAESDPPGSRGADAGGIRVHALRLAGHVAHLEIVFGGPGEVLTVRHDVVDRAAFMPGVLLAIRTVVRSRKFFHGLDMILDAAAKR